MARPDTARQSITGHAAPAMPTIRPARLHLSHTAICFVILVVAVVLGVAMGAVALPPWGVFTDLLGHIPGIHINSGLTEVQSAIVTQIRFPRVILGVLVGMLLAICGAAYQGVFRNPLADPYLLGSASGAGLGATFAIAGGWGGGFTPIAAFVGSLVAVTLTYLLGATGMRSGTATLILAGVAVTSFLTAIQTFVVQQNSDSLKQVYSWILGKLSTTGWSEVLMILPYAVVSVGVLLAYRRVLDVMALGDEEASALGMHPTRARILLIVAASLGTAAAVSVSGLIGFVGIIVPHLVRLICGHSYRSIIPLSALVGGALLVIADIAARMLLAPAEIPIGVVTAFLGAPFFLILLRTSRR